MGIPITFIFGQEGGDGEKARFVRSRFFVATRKRDGPGKAPKRGLDDEASYRMRPPAERAE